MQRNSHSPGKRKMLVRIRNYTIDDIVDSVKYLLDKSAHSEEVRALAVQITYDSQDKISSIFDFIKTNVSYIPDPVTGEDGIELFISPVKQARDFQKGIRLAGDCDDMSLLSCSLFRSIGIRSNVIIVDLAGNGLDHAYSQAWSDKLNEFIPVDPTSQYPLGWQIPYKERIIVS